MRTFLTFLTGAIFGTGIAMSGMANPAKVINFFDVAGSWDPSLAFVMGGAVIVTSLDIGWFCKGRSQCLSRHSTFPRIGSLMRSF